ncbi:hypothetical protein KKC67_03290 [Patescibacteria group bacterium]|nr:hypothetical protein [Patescibacteria group bacterium]
MKLFINQIIQGDCLEVLSKIKGDFVIVTDPPFNIGYHYSNYKDKMEEGNNLLSGTTGALNLINTT